MIIFKIGDLWDHEGRDLAMGRIESGDLHVGTVFTGLFNEDPSQLTPMQPDAHLEVRVVRLLAYEKEWDYLPRGYTAGILLEGKGCELLEEGCYLVAD